MKEECVCMKCHNRNFANTSIYSSSILLLHLTHITFIMCTHVLYVYTPACNSFFCYHDYTFLLIGNKTFIAELNLCRTISIGLGMEAACCCFFFPFPLCWDGSVVEMLYAIDWLKQWSMNWAPKSAKVGWVWE